MKRVFSESGSLHALFEDAFDVGLTQRLEAGQHIVAASLACHHGKVFTVNAHLPEGALQSQCFEKELREAAYSLASYLHRWQCGINAKHVHCELHVFAHRAFVQAVFHPSWCDDGQAQAVGDVVDGWQSGCIL